MKVLTRQNPNTKLTDWIWLLESHEPQFFEFRWISSYVSKYVYNDGTLFISILTFFAHQINLLRIISGYLIGLHTERMLLSQSRMDFWIKSSRKSAWSGKTLFNWIIRLETKRESFLRDWWLHRVVSRQRTDLCSLP